MRLRLDLAYDGTGFHGWAAQPGLRTVQGELQAALATALRVPEVQVWCAGRTDTGVHARGQVAHVDVDEEALANQQGRSPHEPPVTLMNRVNGILPTDIRLHSSAEAPEGFDARFSAIWRRYQYRVADTAASVDPLHRNYVLMWPRALDIDAMNAAALELVGLNDFASFCKAPPKRRESGATTIRTIQELHWERDANGVAVATVQADAFCHSMVRALIGTLIPIGEGRRDVSWAKHLLDQHDKTTAVIVAQAHGLTLEEVGYPPDELLFERTKKTMQRREASELEADDE